MPPVETLALVGEVLSWIGLGVGVPLLLIALLMRLAEGPWLPVDIAIIERDGTTIARWFAGGDFHERPLRRGESSTADDGFTTGVVSSHNPARARVGEPPHARRVLRTLGVVFTAVGVLGLIGSFVPLFLG